MSIEDAYENISLKNQSIRLNVSLIFEYIKNYGCF